MQFLGIGIFQRVLKLCPADAVFDREVLHRLQCSVIPSTSAARASNRRMMSSADRRSSSGFKLIYILPLLRVVFVPSTPMNDDKLSTAGSSSIARARPAADLPSL